MSYNPYPPNAGLLNPCAPAFCSHHDQPDYSSAYPFHQHHRHHHHHHNHPALARMDAPAVRNGVYQYPPGYRNGLESPYRYAWKAPPHEQPPPPQMMPALPAALAPYANLPQPPRWPVHDQSDAHHRTLPREQRGYQPRKSDVVTTYFPKTPAQLAYENEAQARRDGIYSPSKVEPEDKTLDRRWEVIHIDGSRDYMTLATIKNAFPGGEWRATERGQWRYHLNRGAGKPEGYKSDSDDDKKPAPKDKKGDKKDDATAKKPKSDAGTDLLDGYGYGYNYPWAGYNGYGGYGGSHGQGYYPAWHFN